MTGKLLAQIGAGVIGTGNAGSKASLDSFLTTAIFYVFTIGGLFMMYQLIVGALNWINSQGEKDKLIKAQHQIQHAVVGFVVLFAVWIIFVVLIEVFGFAKLGGGGISFEIPSLMK